MRSDLVTLPRESVRALIDMALSGDAACSGHLDVEEVAILRAAALAIGMDPLEATPRHHRCGYRGSCDFDEWYYPENSNPNHWEFRSCNDCHKSEGRPRPSSGKKDRT